MTTATATRRMPYNVTGVVPSLSQVAKFALGLGFNPRLLKANADGAVNVLINAYGQGRSDHLSNELIATGWPFDHTTPEYRWGMHTFSVLALL